MADAPMSVKEWTTELAAIAMYAGGDVESMDTLCEPDFDRSLRAWHATAPEVQDWYRRLAGDLIVAIERFGATEEKVDVRR